MRGSVDLIRYSTCIILGTWYTPGSYVIVVLFVFLRPNIVDGPGSARATGVRRASVACETHQRLHAKYLKRDKRQDVEDLGVRCGAIRGVGWADHLRYILASHLHRILTWFFSFHCSDSRNHLIYPGPPGLPGSGRIWRRCSSNRVVNRTVRGCRWYSDICGVYCVLGLPPVGRSWCGDIQDMTRRPLDDVELHCRLICER